MPTNPLTFPQLRRTAWYQEGLAALDGQDNRVLVLGPGDQSTQRKTTLFAVRSLRANGFDPQVIRPYGNYSRQLDDETKFPFVLSLVRSVGTASETVALLSRIAHLRAEDEKRQDQRPPRELPSVVVIVPQIHAESRFSEITSLLFGQKVCRCRSIECADNRLEAIIHSELISAVKSTYGAAAQRAVTQRYRAPASDAERKLMEEAAQGTGSSGGGGPLPQNIYIGTATNLAIGSTNVTQSQQNFATTTINNLAPHDQRGLIRALRMPEFSEILDAELIEDLDTAITNDRLDNNGDELAEPGQRVTGWVDRINAKVMDSSEKVALGVTGGVIVALIKRYFGL